MGKRIEQEVIEWAVDEDYEYAESWELKGLEGPHAIANQDPSLGSGQVRFQAEFIETMTGIRYSISINYDIATGEFGIIKLASGKP